MKFLGGRNLIGAVVATATIISITGQQASAGQLYNGWNYSIEASGNGSGGSVYDITGLAVTETSDSFIVALNSGMPLDGTIDSGNYWDSSQSSTHIGWGDLFFNFSGKDFQTASQNSQLFAVKFADYSNGTGLSTGIYQGVTAKSITAQHSGYSNLKWYFDWGWGQNSTEGTDLPTQQAVYNYYYPTAVAQNPTGGAQNQYTTPNPGNTPILNAIGQGTKIGSITMLSASDLSATGLDFGHFQANSPQTFGFEFSKSLLPSGDFVSNVFMECGNDGIALKGSVPKSVPESSGVSGIVLAFLTFAGMKLRKYSEKACVVKV